MAGETQLGTKDEIPANLSTGEATSGVNSAFSYLLNIYK